MTRSNPKEVTKKAQHYFDNPDIKVYLSNRKNNKYYTYDPIDKKLVHFGQMGFEDYSMHKQHNDDQRRQNYLLRATYIKGDWKNTPYSPNSLSINWSW